jgi:hypothetical protein
MTNAIKEQIKEAVSYDPTTGVLTWRVRPLSHFKNKSYQLRWNARFAGKPAFDAPHTKGYRHGVFAGKHYTDHRVAWLIANGDWPREGIDHINRQRDDNRLINLREATQRQNTTNRTKAAGKKSRYVGVSRVKGDGKWFAYVGRRGAYQYLGQFACETAAAVARYKVAKAVYGEFV